MNAAVALLVFPFMYHLEVRPRGGGILHIGNWFDIIWGIPSLLGPIRVRMLLVAMHTANGGCSK
jgi:hypothetical protein